eukprot:1137030-Pelagomonas_calceolata.AAC.4
MQDQLAHCIHLYVEDQLMAHFPMLLGFVKKAEQQQKRLNVPDGQCIPHLGPQQAVPIVRDFATSSLLHRCAAVSVVTACPSWAYFVSLHGETSVHLLELALLPPHFCCRVQKAVQRMNDVVLRLHSTALNLRFCCRWQKAVQIMNQEVTQQFARNGGGRDVLQVWPCSLCNILRGVHLLLDGAVGHGIGGSWHRRREEKKNKHEQPGLLQLMLLLTPCRLQILAGSDS